MSSVVRLITSEYSLSDLERRCEDGASGVRLPSLFISTSVNITGGSGWTLDVFALYCLFGFVISLKFNHFKAQCSELPQNTNSSTYAPVRVPYLSRPSWHLAHSLLTAGSVP